MFPVDTILLSQTRIVVRLMEILLDDIKMRSLAPLLNLMRFFKLRACCMVGAVEVILHRPLAAEHACARANLANHR